MFIVPLYYHDEQGIHNEIHVFVSEDLKHDHLAVRHFNKLLIKHFVDKGSMPHATTAVYYSMDVDKHTSIVALLVDMQTRCKQHCSGIDLNKYKT